MLDQWLMFGATIVGMFGSVWSVGWWIAKKLTKFENRLFELERDKWGLAAESEYALRTALANPGLRVPDPRNPGRYIESGERYATPIE